MNNYQIQVRINDVEYWLDIDESSLDVSLTFDIADIKNLSGRNSSYSYPIKLPDSKHNRQVFDYISTLAADSDFDPRKQLRGYLYVNSIPVFDGYIQYRAFTKNIKSGKSYYDVVFYADNDVLFQLGGKYINELDLSQWDHLWDKSNIINSWSEPNGFPYRYGLIDYGYNWELQDIAGGPGATSSRYVTVGEMIPQVSKKLVFDRILYESGISYESIELNSIDFKNEYIGFSGVNILTGKEDIITRASNNGMTQSFNQSHNVISMNDFEDPEGYWNDSNQYFQNTTLNNLQLEIKYTLRLKVSMGNNVEIKPGIYSDLNPDGTSNTQWNSLWGYTVWTIPASDAPIFNGGLISTPSPYFNQFSGDIWDFSVQVPYQITIRPNERIRFGVRVLNVSGGPSCIISNVEITSKSSGLVPGGTMSLTYLLPKKMTQLEFITSCIKERNLYIEPIKNKQNTLLIEPRDRYLDMGKVVEWNGSMIHKVDGVYDIKEKSIVEDKDRYILFTHKEDKDFLNQYYKQEFGEIYGQYEFNTGNEHTKTTQKIETSFSPSILSKVDGSSNFVIPKVVKDNKRHNELISNGRLETNVRCYYWGGLLPFDNDFDRFSFEGNVYYHYPYVGHLSNPYSPTQSIDINFGSPKNVMFNNYGVPYSTYFTRYWEKTLLELTDKDSKLLTLYVKLTPQDIYELKFNHKIFIELDGEGHYYRLNKIYNWNPVTLEPCKVELIKSKDITIPPYPKSKILKYPEDDRPPRPDHPGPEGPGPVGPNTPTPDPPRPPRYPEDVNTPNLNVGAGDITTRPFNKGNVVISNGTIRLESGGQGLFIGGSVSVGEDWSNILNVGNNNNYEPNVSNITTFGSNVTIGESASNILVVGDNITATQSSTSYIGGNTIFSGTVSFSPSASIDFTGITISGLEFGLSEVLDIGRTAGGNMLSMEDDSIILGHTLSTIDDSSPGSIILGGGINDILNSHDSIIIGSSGSTINGLSKTGICGVDNLTATESNTYYFNNIKLFGTMSMPQGRIETDGVTIKPDGVVIKPTSATPSVPENGDVFYRDGKGLIYWRDGRWVDIGTPTQTLLTTSTYSITSSGSISSLNDITEALFTFESNSIYEIECELNLTQPLGSSTINFGMCVNFSGGFDFYSLLYTTWEGNTLIGGSSESSNNVNYLTPVSMNFSSGRRVKVSGKIVTSSSITGQFRWLIDANNGVSISLIPGALFIIKKIS